MAAQGLLFRSEADHRIRLGRPSQSTLASIRLGVSAAGAIFLGSEHAARSHAGSQYLEDFRLTPPVKSMLKMAAFALMPRASVSKAASVKPGAMRSSASMSQVWHASSA